MGPIQSIRDFFGMILRRFWLMAAIFFLGVVITIVVTLELEQVYETTAVIEFDTPVVSDGGIGGTAQPSSIALQLQLIERRLMSRESLGEVIERYGLFVDPPDLTMIERVVALREATTFQTVPVVQAGAIGAEGRLSAMLVTVRIGDPTVATELANEFARRVVEDTYRSVSERTSEALRIFRDQEARLAAEIREVEAEVASFQQQHREALPAGQEFRRDEFQRLQESLLSIERSVQELERERRVFETFGTRSVLATSGSAVGGVSPVASIEAELRLLEVDLARAREVLAPSNPEIQQLEAQVEVLTTRADELRAEARERFVGDIDSQIDLLNSQRDVISERLADLQLAMAEAPGIEVELAAMNLELTRLQERYAVAANQLAEAENAQLLLEAQQSDSMRLLEPAIVPEHPTGPSRTRMVLLGIGVAGLVALIAGFVLELMNPVMRTANSVFSRTGLTPAVAIPEIRSSADRVLGFGRQLGSAALFGLFCAGVIYAAVEFSQPFEGFLTELVDEGLAALGPVSEQAQRRD